MKRKLFFGLFLMVSVTVCVMVAVLSCEHRMDIRNFVEDELARDRTELVVTYYTDAAKTNKYEAPALVTAPADKPNTTVYLPSGKTIYAEVPVENKRELDLQAYIKLDNPSDAQFFDTLDGSTPYFEDMDGEKRHIIAAEDIVTNDGKATITFPLNFKATLKNDTTAEGKSVPVTLVVERIVEGGGVHPLVKKR